MTQRDAFWEMVEQRMEGESRIIILSGDMGAPAMDNIRRRFPHRFFNCGCSEQAMGDVAVGWALEGYWPIMYGIAPFVTGRCYESIKMAAVMGANIMVVGVGAGFGYADAGPTHHGVDDYNIMRIIPGMTVYTVSSNSMAKYCARQVGKGLAYVRLDRDETPELHYHPFPGVVPDMDEAFSKGVWVHKKGKKYILSHGFMVHRVLQVAEKFGWGMIEVFRHPWDDTVVFGEDFVTVEENYSTGGLFSALMERRSGVSTDVITGWGTREGMHEQLGLREEDIISWLTMLD